MVQTIDKKYFTELIKNFKFSELFNELGWDHANTEVPISVDDDRYKLTAAAEKRGFVIFVCSPSTNGKIPLYNTRKKIDAKISRLYFEHLIIYTDKDNFQQVWQLVLREADKPVVVRETPYFQTQQPDLLFQRLRGIFISLDDEEKITIADVRSSVREQFNTNAEKVTKKFYQEFKNQHTAFLKFIEGIENIVDRDWYASLMLNRLMFIYFIQKKGFLDDNINYLNDKLKETQKKKGKDKFYSFYRDFLLVLFHKGLGAPERDDKLIKEIGKVPYLNGGLFDVHQIEENYKHIEISDKAFQKIFDFFDEYNWHLDTRVASSGRDINPDVIGYIFEKYINDRASMGAYYTKEDITEYISKNTIIPFLFDEVKKECSIAFKDESSIWKMLKDNPDRYIYDAVKHGIYINEISTFNKGGDTEEVHKQLRALPADIEIGLDTTQPNLLERRKEWNKPAPVEYALPTEIWREVVERRNRYFEIRKKIDNNEIKEINDFITYNLNIRQFAQDAVEQYEGSDFVNAFYKAIKNITILDPTCGSGAFLFAALNILEPLYESLIQRMRVFIEEDDLNSGKKFSQFRQVLKDIENHPNEKYYIYKSIILNNLYGVDIMNEAVEIAKLRLFLKLVAEVEDFNHLEPLPDIDFNIRAGNTLIGFATKEELDKGLTWSLNLDVDKQKIYDELEIVARAFKRYKEIQLEDKMDHSKFKLAKDELLTRLKKLNDTLNDYLGNDYGKSRKKKKEFEEWLSSYKPFHWFAEFYEIIESGGFDIIIGNPPYVEYSKVKETYLLKNYSTLSCGNLYPFVIEKSMQLLRNKTYFGMIVPISSISTDRMQSYIKMISSYECWCSMYAERPSKLFEGAEVQLVITIIHNLKSNLLFTTKYNKWESIARSNLFQLINYVESSKYHRGSSIVKVGSLIEANILSKIYNVRKHISNYRVNKAKYYLSYRNAGGRYYKIILSFEPSFKVNGISQPSSTYQKLYFEYSDTRDIICSLMNSGLFFWNWSIYSDTWHLLLREIDPFPFDIEDENIKELKNKNILLMKDLDKKSVRRTENRNKGKDTVEFIQYSARDSKLFIDEIDKVLAKHYGFTEVELDFIINYDIKYRMWKELEEEGD